MPAALAGQRIWRQVTVTLAWFSSINARHQAYRRAALWYEPYGESADTESLQSVLKVRRVDSDWQAPRRGTVQHEVFAGEAAPAFPHGQHFAVQVNCRSDAGLSDVEAIPYGIAVTVEIAEETGLAIYDEIETMIRPPVGVPVGTGSP